MPQLTIPKDKQWYAGKVVIRKLQDEGHEAYFVGGCVRDAILGRPCKDIDVFTDAMATQVVDILMTRRSHPVIDKAVLVGMSFGVVKAYCNGVEIDVATYRTEFGYSDGRHPDKVDLGVSMTQDLKRRDFTMNALVMGDYGEIIDLVGGMKDIEDKKIRAIGDPDRRFSEDYLRMLRACRFAAQLGFSIDIDTATAIQKNAHLIKGVSGERIAMELDKIMMSSQPSIGFRCMKDFGLLEHILPEVAATIGVEQPREHHPEGDVFTHLMKIVDLAADSNAPRHIRYGALFHDLGKAPTVRFDEERGRNTFYGHENHSVRLAEGILKRLRYSNEDQKAILPLVQDHMQWRNVPKMKPPKLKRFLAKDDIKSHLELHRLDALAGSGNLENYSYAKGALKMLTPEEIKPPRLVTGQDCMDAGFERGPIIGKLLKEIKELQYEGKIKTREDALEFLREESQFLGKGVN